LRRLRCRARSAVWVLALVGIVLGGTASAAEALRVGTEVDFPPYVDTDAAGRATGFSVELFEAVAHVTDLEARFRPDKWDTVWQQLKAGAIDALPLVARMPEREGQVEFTRPHTFGYDSFFVPAGRAAVASIEQARNLSIIVLRSDAAHHALASRGFERQLVFVDRLADGFHLLASGHHDAVLAPRLQGTMETKRLGLAGAVQAGPLLAEYRREFCFATKKGDIALRDRLDRGLAIVKANGEYDRLYRKWLGIYDPPTMALQHVATGAGAAVVLLALLGLWNWTLRRRVAARTAALTEEITARKAVERELVLRKQGLEEEVAQRTAELARAVENAEQTSRAKSTFLANMSHEMRTPLHVIIGLGYLLRRELTDAVQKQRLDQLCASTDHLLAIINDVLDLSKIEAQRLVLDHSDFTLGAVADKVVRMVEGQAQEKGLALTTDIAPCLRDTALHGDALRLAQVLINLCSNGVKFTDQGEVRLGVASLAENAATVALRFSVADTGIGIAPTDQARLYQAFEQVDSSTTRERGGTGLGLVISQRLVTLMGGCIEVDSRPGVGSTFSFELLLPRATASLPAAAADPAEASAADFSGRRVLFAEDHPLSQEILLEMLEDLGCAVDLASDGAEAVACAQARSYDLILMDMQMPKMDGLTATQAIRGLPGHGRTPIIALTANAFADDRRRCLAAGMNGHVGKPVTPETLAAALGQWLPNLALPGAAALLCDNPLSRALDAIPGLEVGQTWRRSPRRLAEYREQLQRFVELHQPDMALLGAHLDAGKREAAQAVAHNLKGIAGLIGARRVAALAADLERELRAGADAAKLADLTQACADELARLADAMNTLPAELVAG